MIRLIGSYHTRRKCYDNIWFQERHKPDKYTGKQQQSYKLLDLEPVIAYGRLRALFGEPNYETQNFEDAYSYILFVESESSEKIYLEVYEGSSGPAIGGLNNAESLQAAETLKKLIEESEEVADYQYEGYYLDLDSKITMGIKDGVPYYNEEFCEEIPDFH